MNFRLRQLADRIHQTSFLICGVAIITLVSSPALAAEPVISDSGSGQLPEKMILTKDNSLVEWHENWEGENNSPKTFDIFWRLQTGTPENERDGMLLAGTPDGKEICWIPKEDVIVWTTKFLLDPQLPGSDSEGTNYFTVYDDEKMSDPAMEFRGIKGEVPKGYKRFAIITGMPVNEGNDEDALIFPVTVFTGKADASTEGDDNLIEDLQFEVVFVIDTTGSMEPLVEMAMSLMKKVSEDLQTKFSQSQGSVRFGLVEFRDAPAITNKFITRVSLPLNKDPSELQAKLGQIQCNFGDDVPEMVTTGLEKALSTDLAWTRNSSKHIILLGDAPNKDGPSIEDILEKANRKGFGNDDALNAVMIHAVVAYENTLDEQLQTDFKALASGGDKAGLFIKMNSTNLAESTKTIDAFSNDFSSFLDTFLKMKSGDGDDAKASEAEGKMVESLYRILKTSGTLGDKRVHPGYASLQTKNDEIVATKKILVLRDEVRLLWAGLNRISNLFQGLQNGKGNISQVIDSLKEESINVLGIEVTEDTRIAEIIGRDLPMKSNALNLTTAEVALMEPSELETWVVGLKAIQKSSAELMDDITAWEDVNTLMEEPTQIGFFEKSDLP